MHSDFELPRKPFHVIKYKVGQQHILAPALCTCIACDCCVLYGLSCCQFFVIMITLCICENVGVGCIWHGAIDLSKARVSSANHSFKMRCICSFQRKNGSANRVGKVAEWSVAKTRNQNTKKLTVHIGVAPITHFTHVRYNNSNIQGR